MTNRYLDAAAKEEIFFDNTDLIAFNCVTLDLAQMQDAFQQRLEKAMGNVASENADFSVSLFLQQKSCHSHFTPELSVTHFVSSIP